MEDKRVKEKWVKERGLGDLRRRGAVEALEGLGDRESQGGRLV